MLQTACASGSFGAGSSGGGGGGGSQSRRDDHVIVKSFATVEKVAVSQRYVFGATESGIAIYDRMFGRWLAPVTTENSYGVYNSGQITAMAADPVEDALWYGVPGGVVVYRPHTEHTQRSIVTGIPDVIAFERGGSGDAIVRASGQWNRISRTGIATPISSPPAGNRLHVSPTLNDVYRAFPSLRGQLSFLMRASAPNRPMRQAQPISGTTTPDRTTEAWIGTNGDGMWRVDATFMQGKAFRFGPIEGSTGALAAAADGVWIAGLGRSSVRGGISYGSNDMQHWEWIEGTIAVPMVSVAARSLSVREQRAWIGTERGLVRAMLDGARDMISWTSLDGLPGDRIYSIAARNNGAWVGTDRGVAWVSDSAEYRDKETRGVERVFLENMPVRALLAIGDTLWVGTDAGLMAIDERNDELLRPVSNDPEIRHPIRALAWSDTMLIAATDNSLLRVTPRGGAAPSRLNVDITSVGQVTRVAIDDRTIFVAGTDGLIAYQREDGLLRRMPVGPGADIPGAALDIVAHRDWLWVGTTEGLVRFRRAADGRLLR